MSARRCSTSCRPTGRRIRRSPITGSCPARAAETTARLVAIDIAIGGSGATNTNPVETSTSGCQQADYDAAGFQAGDIALIQRGTCTFVAKVALAIANGASAVTTNETVLAAPAPYDNTLVGNRGHGNGEFDGYDGNVDPPCDNNEWRASHFGTVNQPCIVGPGGSGDARGRTGTHGRSADAGQDVGRNAPPAGT